MNTGPGPSRAASIRRATILLLALGVGGALRAGCNEWTTSGPWGGTIQALAVDPFTPTTVYAAAEWGILYKSTDGGLTWAEKTRGLPPAERFLYGLILTDPYAPGIVYVDVFSDWSSILYRSDDAGESWFPAMGGLQEKQFFSGLALDPHVSGALYAFVVNQDDEVRLYRTEDRGASWFQASTWAPRWSCGLVADPRDPLILYATCRGLYKSGDGGDTWTEWGTGLPADSWPGGLTIDPCAPEVMYLTINGTVYRSRDGGAAWVSLRGSQPVPAYHITIDPSEPSTVYFGTGADGVYKSPDGGDTWSEANAGLRADQVRALAVAPGLPGTLYAGTMAAGVFKSEDGAASWTPRNAGLPGVGILSLAIDPAAPQKVYAGTLDGLFASTDGGRSWEGPNLGIPFGWVYAVAVAPSTPPALYASLATFSGPPVPMMYKSQDGGLTWTKADWGLWDTAVAIAADPVTPETVYALSLNGVYKTVDGGMSWTFSSDGLPEESGYGPLAMDPSNPSTLYTGTNDMDSSIHGVFKTADGGASWTTGSAGLESVPAIWSLAVDPSDSTVIYAGSHPGVFKSTDGGTSWRPSNTGLPAGKSCGSLVIDPRAPSTLYAGCFSSGVFKSTGSASTWRPLNEGFPAWFGSIEALAVDPSDPSRVYAGTWRGVFSVTQADVPGDCGGDHQVSIGEVQRAINMFVWGTTPACHVDRDGSGTVTIGEVQSVINVFLGVEDGCP